MEIITSPQNTFIKTAASLKQKKYRDETGYDGIRILLL